MKSEKTISTKSEEKLLNDIIVALCRDYDRRKRCALASSMSKRVIMEYVYINSKLYDAAAEVAGPSFAEEYIYDIGNGIGYARTKLGAFAESTYKNYKARIKSSMLRKLKFID